MPDKYIPEWTTDAADDFDEINEYIAQDSLNAADRLAQKILEMN